MKNTPVSDLTPLHTLTQRAFLDLTETKVKDAQIKALRMAFLHCNIIASSRAATNHPTLLKTDEGTYSRAVKQCGSAWCLVEELESGHDGGTSRSYEICFQDGHIYQVRHERWDSWGNREFVTLERQESP